MEEESKTCKRLYSIEDLEQILDQIPYEIWLKDKEGRHVYVNKKVTSKLGIQKNQILGKTDKDIRPKEYWDKCYITDKQVIKEDKVIFYEEEFEENKKKFYNVCKFPIKNKENSLKLIGGFANETIYTKHINKELTDLFSNAAKVEEIDMKKTLSRILDEICEVSNSSSMNLFLVDESSTTLNTYINSNNNIFLDEASIDIDYKEFINLYNNNLQIDIQDVLNIDFKAKYNERINIGINSKARILPLKTSKNNIFGILYIYYEDISKCNNIYDAFINDILVRIANFLINIGVRDKLIKKLLKIENENKNLEYEMDKLEEIINSEMIKVNFLENISHEFRTPINVILMTSKLLLSLAQNSDKVDLDKDKIINYLKIIRQNGYRILRLVNNILESTIVESKYYKLEMNNYNIVNIIEDTVLSAAKYIEHTNKTIIFDTEEEEIILACKSESIEKVILNLIANSLKFVDDDGNIQVEIKVDYEEEKVFVHIKNDGPSISKENSTLIFNRFAQVDNNLTRQSEGSGVGLYLVKCLVERHGGKIWLNTEVDRGVEFIFSLPIKTTNQEDIRTHCIDEHSMIDKCNIEFSDVYSI